LLSFTNVYFSESGFFNGLRAIQVKNRLARLNCPKPFRIELLQYPSYLGLRHSLQCK
jgi:hypothetical protein